MGTCAGPVRYLCGACAGPVGGLWDDLWDALWDDLWDDLWEEERSCGGLWKGFWGELVGACWSLEDLWGVCEKSVSKGSCKRGREG